MQWKRGFEKDRQRDNIKTERDFSWEGGAFKKFKELESSSIAEEREASEFVTF